MNVSGILNAVVTHFRDNITAFNPDLKAITLEEFWALSTTKEQLVAQLPCIVVGLTSAQPDTKKFSGAKQEAVGLAINLLQIIPTAGSKQAGMILNFDVLLNLLTEEHLAPLIETALGFNCLEVDVGECKPNNALSDFNVSWFQAPVNILTGRI